jgi:hypothetical protein
MPFGFKDSAKEWQGPVAREFRKVSTAHTNTVRYDCSLDSGTYMWYVPKFLLSGVGKDNNWPDAITVNIGKSYNTRQTLGFKPKSIPLHVGEGVCEFEFDEEKGNVYRYLIIYDAYEKPNSNQRYYLYIPKAEFGNEMRPDVIYAKLLTVSYKE